MSVANANGAGRKKTQRQPSSVSRPLNIAATNGIAPEEQGLAGGLVNTSFQFGGALVLAIVTAVANANGASEGSGQGLLDGFHAAIWVSLAAAVLGVLAMALPARARAVAVEAA